MEEGRVDVSFAANEVFDLLPESYETLPLAAITDAFFGAEVSRIVLSEVNYPDPKRDRGLQDLVTLSRRGVCISPIWS